jgi:hypothetical protein
MTYWFAAIVAVALSLGQPGQTGGHVPFDAWVPPAERLWIAHIAKGEAEAYPGESNRVAKACGADPEFLACRARNLKSARYPVATLHAAPSGSSAVLATILEERQVLTTGELVFAWSIEMTAKAGTRLAWLEAERMLDDYGLYVAGVQRRGDWVRLLGSIPVDGWLRVAPSPTPDGQPSPLLFVWVTPLAGHIVTLSALEARWPDGRRQQIEEGRDYLVQKVVGDVVEFRTEVPSDFPCGEAVSDPPEKPPTLRAPTSEFFGPGGAPRFFPKYTRGCCPAPSDTPAPWDLPVSA